MEQIHKVVGQIHVKSCVLNPLLWLFAVAAAMFLLAAYYMPTYAGWLIAIPIVILVFTLVAYAYFACKDPNRLQSEEFQIRQQEMLQLRQGQKEIEIIDDRNYLPNPSVSQVADQSGDK